MLDSARYDKCLVPVIWPQDRVFRCCGVRNGATHSIGSNDLDILFVITISKPLGCVECCLFR